MSRTAGFFVTIGGVYLVKYDLNTRRREERRKHLEQYADNEEKQSQEAWLSTECIPNAYI